MILLSIISFQLRAEPDFAYLLRRSCVGVIYLVTHGRPYDVVTRNVLFVWCPLYCIVRGTKYFKSGSIIDALLLFLYTSNVVLSENLREIISYAHNIIHIHSTIFIKINIMIFPIVYFALSEPLTLYLISLPSNCQSRNVGIIWRIFD